MAECKVDDIICQLETLQALKTLERNLGKDSFLTKYPQLDGMQGLLKEEIETAQQSLKGSINACGNIDPDELPEEVLEET